MEASIWFHEQKSWWEHTWCHDGVFNAQYMNHDTLFINSTISAEVIVYHGDHILRQSRNCTENIDNLTQLQ